MESDRRREPRFSFVAYAEVEEENSGMRIKSRISDLSLGGCYVDTIHPLPYGTRVHVKILTEQKSFQAPATVVYSVAHLGMGLVFRDVQPDSLTTLHGWVPAEQRPGAHQPFSQA
jgi:PilZ domain